MQLHRMGTTPGMLSGSESTDENIFASNVARDNNPVVTKSAYVDKDEVDAGNVPTTTIRAGNVMGESSGKAVIYDPTANDGSQQVVGVLPFTRTMLGKNGVAADLWEMLVAHGLVAKDKLIGLDAAAEAVLERMGVRVMSGELEPNGAAFLVHPKGQAQHAENYTVTAGDNGKLLIATAAVNFTLPTVAHGLSFEFVQTADANLVITGAGNIIAKGNAAADTLTFSTASNKIGARVRVLAVRVGDAYKWLAEELSTCTITVASE